MNDKEFIRAVNANQIEKVREILPTISSELLNMMHDSRTQEGKMAAIHVAAAKGHIEILKLLINDSRTNVNLRTTGNNYNPLHLAAVHGHFEACVLLLPINEVVQIDSSRAYLLAANRIDENEGTEKGIQYAKIADLLRVPTFVKGCEIGFLRLIKTMVEEGVVDINAKYNDDWGLKTACEHHHIAVVDYLLSLPQIDVSMTNFSGNTILHILCIREQLKEQFLPLQDCDIKTPSIRFQLIDKLIKHGADANARNTAGYTPLFHATASNLLDAVKALVTNGADLTLQYQRDTTMGFTAEEFANSKKRMRQLIQSHEHLYAKFAPLLKGEDDLEVSLEEIPRGVFEADIFSIAKRYPQILHYLEAARKSGSNGIEGIKATNESLCILINKHKKNRGEAGFYQNLPTEQDHPMSPKPF